MHHGNTLKKMLDKKGISKTEFAAKLGLSRGGLYVKFGEQQFDDKFLQLLKENDIVIQSHNELPSGTPYLGELDIFAGKTDLDNMDLSEYITDFISIPGFRDANYFANVRGHSMYPKYAAGEIIAIKRVFDFEEIQFGQAYVIVTPENRVIKSIRKSSHKDRWLLESCNKEFDNYEIEVKKVKALFLVLGKITKDVL